MSFDIEAVAKDMLSAMQGAVENDVGDIEDYAKTILENEKESLKELGEARLRGEISEAEFDKVLKVLRPHLEGGNEELRVASADALVRLGGA